MMRFVRIFFFVFDALQLGRKKCNIRVFMAKYPLKPEPQILNTNS